LVEAALGSRASRATALMIPWTTPGHSYNLTSLSIKMDLYTTRTFPRIYFYLFATIWTIYLSIDYFWMIYPTFHYALLFFGLD